MRLAEAVFGLYLRLRPPAESLAVLEWQKSAAPMGAARSGFEFMMDWMVMRGGFADFQVKNGLTRKC